jgi:hypothetical protein
MPVSVFLMRTVAPGIAALLLSTTVPVIVLVPAVWAMESGGCRHKTRKAANARKKETLLGQRVEKFSFMVTASKNHYGKFGPADWVDKRHDGAVEISGLEILRPFIHVVLTGVSCQDGKTGERVSAGAGIDPLRWAIVTEQLACAKAQDWASSRAF